MWMTEMIKLRQKLLAMEKEIGARISITTSLPRLPASC